MALAGDGSAAGVDLRDAIFEADFERAATNGQLAVRRGVSRRHFQRRRAHAVGAIARYARALLASSEAEPESHPRRHSWRFERERAEYLRAREAGATLAMRAIAASLERLAGGRETRALAKRLCAEASAHLGRTEDVRARLGDLLPGERLYLQTKLGVLDGDLDAAQVRLTQLLPWQASVRADEPPLRAWERTALEIETARHCAREGRWSEAEGAALLALSSAEPRGWLGLAALCAATLSACSGARGAADEALAWRARALARLLATQDCVLACGLFRRTRRIRRLDASLSEVLHARLCLVVPQMLSDAPRQAVAVRELLAALFDRMVCERRDADLTAAAAAVGRSDSALAHYLERYVDGTAEILALAVAALAQLPWTAALQSAHDALAAVALDVRPGVRRTIAISLPSRPQSQTEVIEHLRVDAANLRLRFVSLRAGTRSALPWRCRDSVVGTAVAASAAADSR